MPRFHLSNIDGQSVDVHPTCPECGQPVQFGDGVDTPPLYCNNCNIAWQSPDELEYHRPTLDDHDFNADADLDAAEQWMHEHGGYPYQEGPDSAQDPTEL